ncbi:MAG: DUF2934 domain-containing protein [Candidatus Melainabacteria bacterium]|nr:DUF2934 domain-containing protein [Candidatus Melainabacteria bacterium]
MFGPKCARTVRRKLEAARIAAIASSEPAIKFDPLSANVGTTRATKSGETPTPTEARQCVYCSTDVSGLPDARVCEQCSNEKCVCQRCNRKLGIKRVRVQQPVRTQPTGQRAPDAPPHPLVVTPPRHSGKSGHGTGVAAELGLEVVSLPQPPTEEEVALRAYFIWTASGYSHGHDQSDWEQARQELVTERIAAE